jgi:hypothetical protein
MLKLSNLGYLGLKGLPICGCQFLIGTPFGGTGTKQTIAVSSKGRAGGMGSG